LTVVKLVLLFRFAMRSPIYNIIKKQNGEKFAQAISRYDNGIFQVPDLPNIVKYAGRDAMPLLPWLESLKRVKIQPQKNHGDPLELLSRAGYDAYVADTLAKQNAIEKYFAPNERLCTFSDETRFKNYFIINAVRRDADSVVRSPNPQREDKYGTSVISIQICKMSPFISIKNRYNHTVECPDNTFNSNPDNIIEGLSDAIKNFFGVDFSASSVAMPNNYVLVGNQICKYNAEQHGVYFGSDFYIRDGRVHNLEKNIEWMVHPGVIFNVSKKEAEIVLWNKDSADGLYWVKDFLRREIKKKAVQIPKNTYGGYDILANGKKIFSFKDGVMTWIGHYHDICGDAGVCYSKFVGDVLDFIGLPNCYFENVDFSNVKYVIWPTYAKRVYLNRVTGLHGIMDFSQVRDLTICDCDLSGVALKLNSKANSIDLSYVTGWSGHYDLSDVQLFDCIGTGADHVKMKLNPTGLIRGLNPSHKAYQDYFEARRNLQSQLQSGRAH